MAKSYSINEQLGEDIMQPGTSLCVGCGADLAFRFLFRIIDTKDLIIYGSPGCFLPEIWQTVATTTLSSLMTTVPSTMTGASRYFRKVGREATLVAFVGDGCTADIGFQPLSAAAERGEQVIYVCYDNEAYQNTGIQRSGTTPYGAWSMTDQIGVKGSGKAQPAKYLPLIMAMHGIAYTATLSIAHLDDFAQKVKKAKAAVKEGFVYLHILAPCPTGWRARPEDCIEMARLAVDTNFFPLWEAERGTFRFTHLPKSISPITEFTDLQGRFRHLTKQQLDELQAIVNKKFATISALTRIEA
ncbi:thiamine pyrophosphate-dependent enzyme [Chloroflexota bacterium]